MIQDKMPEEMTREELIAETGLGWRYLWATGRNEWPSEEEFARLEKIQADMAAEHDAENAKENSRG